MRRRGQAYSQDLRDRVLAAVGEPIRLIAARLSVSASYVSKVQGKARAPARERRGRSATMSRRGLNCFTTCCAPAWRSRRM